MTHVAITSTRRALAVALGAAMVLALATTATAQTPPGQATPSIDPLPPGPPQPLKAGDRVAFFGDSITAQDLYTTFVANHYLALRPDMKLQFKNAGVGGDQLSNGIARIDRDLVPFKPTVITCCFGMNDAGYVPPDDPKATTNLAKYREDYAKMVGLLRDKCPGARIILFTTTVVGPTKLKRYNETLGQFSAFVREFGKEQKLQVVELYYPMMKWVEQGETMGLIDNLIPDGVHPNAAGQFLMAELILKQLTEQ